jgi:hypothetical protein
MVQKSASLLVTNASLTGLASGLDDEHADIERTLIATANSLYLNPVFMLSPKCRESVGSICNSIRETNPLSPEASHINARSCDSTNELENPGIAVSGRCCRGHFYSHFYKG